MLKTTFFSFLSLCASLLAAFAMMIVPANAQTQAPQDEDARPRINIPDLPQPELEPFDPQIEAPDILEIPQNPSDDVLDNEILRTPPNLDDEIGEEDDIIPDGVDGESLTDKPDYSQLSSNAEREMRLTDLFAKLKDETNPEDANLIAEEIWVIWLDSGSASVNLVLRRGSDAQTKGQNKKARRMFDHVTTLAPDYSEGWARSSRLALEEKNYSRALTEAAQTLALEPRHFYALWTLGNAFEQLGRQEEALEAYRESHALYPELPAVKTRLEQLANELEGDVL
ncbi:MAG: tetratricopeptide repeat protein [Litorimonas sp.]